MNKLKEIGNKFYQEVEVVMLATRDVIGEAPIMQEDDKLYPVREFGNRNFYFLSNEEIKEGDWALDLSEDMGNKYEPFVVTTTTLKYAKQECKKIIATTDNLQIADYANQHTDYNPSKYLPQPSQSFIQVYIKSYNEDKTITKVLVEMFDNGEEDWIGDDDNGEPFWNSKFELKVNSSNEITIKKIKDSWTREELRPKFLKLCHDVADYIEKGYDEKTEFNIDNWIEENL